MPVSEAKRKNNDKYNAACDYINVRPKKEIVAEIKAAAQASGQSLRGYILQACRAAMDPATVSLPLTGGGDPQRQSGKLQRPQGDLSRTGFWRRSEKNHDESVEVVILFLS